MKVVEEGNVQEPVKDEKKSSEIDIEVLVKFGRVEKEWESIPGLKLKMHTLKDKERQKAVSLLSDKEFPTTMNKMAAARLADLAYAITEINGKKFETDDDKKALFQLLQENQSAVNDLLFAEYATLLVEQAKLMEDGLKK